MNFVLRLGRYISVIILTEWLQLEDFIHFDTALGKNDRTSLNSWVYAYSDVFSSSMFNANHQYPIGVVPWAKNRKLLFRGSIVLSMYSLENYDCLKILGNSTIKKVFCNKINDTQLLQSVILSCVNI